MIPNPLTAGGRLAGAAIGMGAGIFSTLTQPSRDPIPVRVAKVDSGIVQEFGPSTVILQLIQDGVTIEEIEYELRRRQNTDQILRIPRGVTF